MQIKPLTHADGRAMLALKPDALAESIFKQLIVPFIETAKKTMTPMELALLYSGFLTACISEMAGDFQPEVLLHLLQDRIDCVKSVTEPSGSLQ